MRLVMTLLVRDEEDVVATNVDYHLSQGVDFVIALDHRSRDATPRILEDFERRGVLRLLRSEEVIMRQARWVTEMARLAVNEHAADWVINNDADEFWWPRTGTLRSALAALPGDVSVVGAPRANFRPSADERGPFWERLVVRDRISLNALGRPLLSKRCHRADPEVIAAGGSHQVTVPGGGRAATTLPLEILHFPYRRYDQFQRSVTNYGESINLRHVRFAPKGHLFALYRAGLLREHWHALQVDPRRVDAGTASPALQVDTRLRDHLRALYGAGMPGVAGGAVT